MGVEFERDENESAGEGHKTDSTAKKHPATAALKPTIHGIYLGYKQNHTWVKIIN